MPTTETAGTPELRAALRGGSRDDILAGFRAPEVWDRARTGPLTGKALAAFAALAADGPAALEPLSFSAYRGFADDGTRAAYETAHVRRRHLLAAHAITALQRPDAGLGPLEDVLWAICDEYAWALPAHLDGLLAPDPEVPHPEQIDLSAAETAFTLAELRELFRDRMSPLVAERIRQEVTRRVLTPFQQQRPWWETCDTNWAAVCAGGVGMAALYLTEEEDPLLDITARAIAAMRRFLSGFTDDGVCGEGLSYWNYGFGFYAIYADALRRRTAGRIDLLDDPTGKTERIARFPQRIVLSGTTVAAFSDSHPEGTLLPGIIGLLRRRFPDTVALPDAALLATEPVGLAAKWAPAVRWMVWSAESAEPLPSPPPADPGGYLPDAQWMIGRGHDIGFAAKGGHNAELHNHNDLGSFVLAASGEPRLAELGMGAYDRRYFSPDRYDILCTGSQGHSVPLVNGTPQHDGRDAAAEVFTAEHAADRTRFRLDIRRAYPVPSLTALIRGFEFDGETLTVRDDIRGSEDLAITERFVSFAPIELTGPGRALIRGRTAALHLTYAPAGWRARIREHPHVRHDRVPVPVYSLDLERTGRELTFELRARRV